MDISNKRLYYFVNSSYLHGVRFLDGQYGLIDRIYWLGILIASTFGMILIFIYATNGFANDAISINLDANYLEWENTFPAISFCMFHPLNPRSADIIKRFGNEYYMQHEIEEPESSLLYDHLLQYLFLTPLEQEFFEELDVCYEINTTCGVNLDTLKRLLIPHDCRAIFSDIQFNDKRFDNCNDILKLQTTEMGTCFTANGVYFYDFDLGKLPLTYSQMDLQRKFTFDFTPDSLYSVHIFIHSPEYFPNFNSKVTFEPFSYNTKYEYLIQAIETDNSINTREESIAKRQRRFPDERWPSNATLPYSFASCLTYVRVQLELELCNCTIHTSPREYKDQYCNYKQIQCIRKHQTAKKTLHHHHNVEPCLPSCTEMEINLVGEIIILKPEEPTEELRGMYEISPENLKKTTITIEIQNKPTLRLVRNVSFTRLDFVVGIGGIIGLFFGASILGLAEIIFIWMIRQF